jgi:hypothetical protein
MKLSFLDHFNSIASSLQPQLLSEQCAVSLNELCSFFPFDITSEFGFESRLGKNEAFCDFFLKIKKNTPVSEILAGKSTFSSLSPLLLREPKWQKIVKIFDIWTTAGSSLGQVVEEFWLEFDYKDSSYNTTPNIFFGITESKEENSGMQWESRLRVLDEIFDILFEIPFPPALAKNLMACITALPDNSGLKHIGFMIPRQTEAVRLILVNLETNKLEQYLKEIRWPGNYQEVRKIVDSYSAIFNYFVFNINIGESVDPYLGIEMYFPKLLQPQFNNRWDVAFDFLESEKLLTREKRVALTSFCGVRKVSRIFPVSYFNVINHLKLVYKQNTAAECKAYFGTFIR